MPYKVLDAIWDDWLLCFFAVVAGATGSYIFSNSSIPKKYIEIMFFSFLALAMVVGYRVVSLREKSKHKLYRRITKIERKLDSIQKGLYKNKR